MGYMKLASQCRKKPNILGILSPPYGEKKTKKQVKCSEKANSVVSYNTRSLLVVGSRVGVGKKYLADI